MKCACCRFPTPPNDRLPFGSGVAHAVCAMAAQLRDVRKPKEVPRA